MVIETSIPDRFIVIAVVSASLLLVLVCVNVI